jgi:hypothetical protein
MKTKLKELAGLGCLCLFLAVGTQSFGQSKVEKPKTLLPVSQRPAVVASADETTIQPLVKTTQPQSITAGSVAEKSTAVSQTENQSVEISLTPVIDPEVLKEAEIIRQNNLAIERSKK